MNLFLINIKHTIPISLLLLFCRFYSKIMSKFPRKRIVILGAGYAGMFLASNLAKEHTSFEIILVDRNPYHQLLQEIHLVASGYRKPEDVIIPLSYLIKGLHIDFIQSTVKGILADKNEVVLDNESIHYDILVICLGSSVQYFNIKGAEENTLPLRSITDAAAIYQRIDSLLHNTLSVTNNDKYNEEKNLVIVGGGATGASLAGAIADLIDEKRNTTSQNDSNKTPPIFVTVIEALPDILPGWNKHLVLKVKEILRRKGIRIITNQAVTDISKSKVILKDGQEIDSSLVIWTAGVKAFAIDIKPDVEKTPNGRIIVNRFCQNDTFANIFAIGDIAAVKDSHDKMYPPLAQIAVRQAKYLAEIIPKYAESVNGNNTRDFGSGHIARAKVFDYDIKTQLISLGYDEYVGVLENHVISGSLAKVIDEFAKNTYIKTLTAGGKNISSHLYEKDILSKMLSGITFAGFTFAKYVRNSGI